MVQSIVSDGVLSLSFEEAKSNTDGRHIVDYRVVRGDGHALPQWMERPSVDLVQGTRSADTETINLTITAIYSDGSDASENVRINTTDGTIQSLPRKHSNFGHKLFGKQFAGGSALAKNQREALADLLSWDR